MPTLLVQVPSLLQQVLGLRLWQLKQLVSNFRNQIKKCHQRLERLLKHDCSVEICVKQSLQSHTFANSMISSLAFFLESGGIASISSQGNTAGSCL